MLELGRNGERGLGCSSLTMSRSCYLSPPGFGGSCCSYLWIVPISSVKSGIQQAHYWMPDNAKGNPALP